MANVLVIAELAAGASRKTTLSAVAFAKTASEGGAFDIHVIGEGAAGAAAALKGYGARKLITTEIAGGYTNEAYAPSIAAVAAEGYEVIVATANTFGKDLLPRVAAKLEAGVASDISAVTIDGGELIYTRPMYAGNVKGSLKITTPIAVVTVRQSEFEAATESGGESPIENVDATDGGDAASKIEVIGLEVIESERPDLAEADVVVSGGRSLKSSENFENVLEPLVDALGAAMGASRAAVDAGYVPNELQVGQTGKVVAPKLYIAVGISGAIQHLAGMKGSKTIVSINKDKEAPIAQVSDYFFVADLFDAVPALTAAVNKAKAEG
ncbi:MAG: electron transfer flavoprotein alpha subunit [Polyangiales bacterium]|jgi:electron transfer flavoprotein alpha subunit